MTLRTPTDEERGWGEILTAAALQGMVFALVKAAIDRAGATGTPPHRPLAGLTLSRPHIAS